MAVLVHLAPEKARASIERNGVKSSPAFGRWPKGVYAMPVLPDYFVSHQWMRELKRSGARTFLGARFRLPAREEVYVGHFSSEPLVLPLSRAFRIIMAAPDARGYQILVPRSIRAG